MKQWQDRALNETRPTALINGIVALARNVPKELEPQAISALSRLQLSSLSQDQVLEALRAYGLVFIILVIIVFRFGLVPLAIATFTVDMLANVPLTADFSEWYMGTTVLALLSIVALACWGFYHSLGGGPVWTGAEGVCLLCDYRWLGGGLCLAEEPD